ncbi:ParB/RepB/Spo0J family partition protein [Dactylosporangium sp. CA-139066]|uniref:ParB/RepB/Spo0J family partition protein n=1 Tax=Dactylosporangium sp. CA-139066 TaxID=3239930 RepID=UPI003D93F575
MAPATATIADQEQPTTQPADTASDDRPATRPSRFPHLEVRLDHIVINIDNLRDDAAALPGIVDNLRDDGTDGLISSVVVGTLPDDASVPVNGEQYRVGDLPDDYYLLIDGEQRYRSAVEAGLEYILAIVRDDLMTKDRQLITALRQVHRNTLTDTQKSRGIEQLALAVDLPDEDIARKIGYQPDEVRAARAFARLPRTVAEQSAAIGLSFNQNQHLADIIEAGDEDAQQRLLKAANEGEHEFWREAGVIRRQRDADAKYTARRAELVEAGVRLLTGRPEWSDRNPAELRELRTADGQRVTAEAHASCSFHAVYLTKGYDGPSETTYCLAWRQAKHTKVGTNPPRKMTEKEKTERRRTITNNRDLEAANEVRRKWLIDFLASNKAPKGAARYLALALTSNWGIVHGSWKDALSTLETLLYPGKPVQHERNFLANRPTDARCTVIAVAAVAAAVESSIARWSWKNPSRLMSATFELYAANGYSLGRVEREMVDANAARTRRTTAATTRPNLTLVPTPADPADDEPEDLEDPTAEPLDGEPEDVADLAA